MDLSARTRQKGVCWAAREEGVRVFSNTSVNGAHVH